MIINIVIITSIILLLTYIMHLAYKMIKHKGAKIIYPAISGETLIPNDTSYFNDSLSVNVSVSSKHIMCFFNITFDHTKVKSIKIREDLNGDKSIFTIAINKTYCNFVPNKNIDSINELLRISKVSLKNIKKLIYIIQEANNRVKILK